MDKFIFFYSPLYTFYHEHITKNLSGLFDVESVLIDDIQNNNKRHTFWGGVSVKIEIIIQKIKENMDKNILFSDATIFINQNNRHQLVDFFNLYKTNDLCFADNDGRGYYNIGLILIKCTHATLHFFENVLHDLTQSKGWDQDVINKHLQGRHTMKVSVFDNKKILCGYEFNASLRDQYLIFKSFIDHTPNSITNFNRRLDIFKYAGLITSEEYSHYYR